MLPVQSLVVASAVGGWLDWFPGSGEHDMVYTRDDISIPASVSSLDGVSLVWGFRANGNSWLDGVLTSAEVSKMEVSIWATLWWSAKRSVSRPPTLWLAMMHEIPRIWLRQLP
jgi:hypothetical protein